ncbi:single-stranded-DNA-specific exonuclease RecJ [Woodsholea maritima]|uniref:single-stranded-DNA-specific exonuclease RecJ n=1 Tax=Woodsholea maritima TaxID=240237 RepID=UPI00036846E5|nr:single-stranded-DNA-specific exonuclease RecJ [Woodsholea maritima]
MTGQIMDDALFGVSHSITGRTWRLKQADDQHVAEIVRLAGCPDALARMLAARGITPDGAERFLNPRLRDVFPDPSLFRDMDLAARLIWDAVQADHRIAIFADYDVDGATSGAQLTRWLKSQGADPLLYVPDRLEEGYGPSELAFQRLKAAGAQLVITLDCGAAALEPLKCAAAMDLPVIVVDHHMMKDERPPCLALVNPNQEGDQSGCGILAAAGVVFVLLAALNREGRRRGGFSADHPEPDIMAWLDLAALGTICDVVPLEGLNRAIVAQGLKVMAQSSTLGLRALCEASGAKPPFSPYHAGFLMGPRINAGGRIGKADLGLTLLTTHNEAEAEAIARQLSELNDERKAIEAEVQHEASLQIERQAILEETGFIMAAGEGWHPGVIGIVAGRLKDRFNRPCIIIGLDRELGIGKGSGRSCPGVNLGAAISAAADQGLLMAGGGHPMAGGLTIAYDQVEAFGAFMAQRLSPQWLAADEARSLILDGVLMPGAVSYDLWTRLQGAGPYGAGHGEPRFGFSRLRKTFAKRVGADHVRYSFEGEDGKRLNGIAWRCADAPLGEALLNGPEGFWHAVGKIKGEDGAYGRKAELQLEDLAYCES